MSLSPTCTTVHCPLTQTLLFQIPDGLAIGSSHSPGQTFLLPTLSRALSTITRSLDQGLSSDPQP